MSDHAPAPSTGTAGTDAARLEGGSEGQAASTAGALPDPRWQRAAPWLLAVMVLVVLGDLLLSCDGTIASHRIGDGTRYFVYQRDFGFGELRQGNLPLWNPHQFSGTPFVGAFQSAMLYPPNWVHLLVPVATGINLELAFHLLMLACGTWVWVRGRGVSAPAALLSAAVVAFGATASLRVLAGQLTVLATYAWVPLLLCCVDRLARRASLGWTLVASGATAMTLLAGHLPTAFMSALALGLYTLPVLLRSEHPLRLAGALASMGAVALLLAGAQLAAGFDVARESIREAGMPFDFATAYSFPPENLLTLFLPTLFGNADPLVVRYFGRWYYWDASVFIGTGAFALALLGAVAGRGRGRGLALALAAALGCLALGSYTPLYEGLHRWVPGFDFFRAPSKFMFHASLFLALLVGLGADALLAAPRDARVPVRRLAMALALGALVLAGLAVWSATHADPTTGGPWLLRALAELREDAGPSPRRMAVWTRIAVRGLAMAAAVWAGMALLLWLARSRRWAAGLALGLCIAELLIFARANRGGVAADFGLALHSRLYGVYARAGEDRVLEVDEAINFAMGTRGHSVWGYDPVVLGRYTAFMARLQGQAPGSLDNVDGRPPSRFHPLLRLLRTEVELRFPGLPRGEGIVHHEGAWPRFAFVGRHRVVQGPEAAFRAMLRESFDPREVVILESEPVPAPSGGPVHGSVTVVEESTDHLVLEVELDAAAILMVTDSFSDSWRAVALPGSVQQRYRVQPADGVLRGIALAPGHHRLRLEYWPPSLSAGLSASGLGALLWLAGAVVWWRGRPRP